MVAEVYELAGASRRSGEQMARAVGQTAARWRVSSVISERALSVCEIARRLGLARQSVQRVVDDIAASKQVVLRVNPRDRRAPRVSLTPAGHASLARLFDASQGDRDDVLRRSGLSVEALVAARTTLSTLIDALAERHGGTSRRE